jgi:hypothetical protein
MSRKLLGYDDAVKLLGGDSKLVTALGRLTTASITGAAVVGLVHGNVPAAISLFELKNEVVDQGHEAVKSLRQRLTGLSRFKRSELLEAAHAVLVVSAFFAALDDLDSDMCTGLNTVSLELTKQEQAGLAARAVPQFPAGLPELARQLITPGRIPGLDGGLAGQGNALLSYYIQMASVIRDFAPGTAAWDQQNKTMREGWSQAIVQALPQLALSRYEEQLVRLAGEFPEFAFWAHRVGAQAILQELRAARQDTAQFSTALQTAAGVLASAARGSDPGKVRADLVARYVEQIARPVAGVDLGTIPDGVHLPALRELYVNPSYKTLQLSRIGSIEQLADPIWQKAPAYPDLGTMVLEHLISVEAAHVPMVLLGQPGAGKSVCTQMLAAELDPRDFLVVRVELRAVPADMGIQEQIEAALTNLTGRSIHWPDLADSAGDAQPVILLDGFDELLQASGISHADYLERVQAFQEREAELLRPVAVLVTSRTAVANQVRYPEGTVVVRLEQFDPKQVSDWLNIWNQANSARPLAAKTALAQGDLARQPLLLFLLAFFHSGGGNLTPGLSQAHLYQQLFTSFVERDVRKLHADFTEREEQRAVQHDLDHLSMVAFAMFNRGHQSITETDLIADLTALEPGQTRTPGPAARAAALSIAERIAGRFFFRLFVHRDQSLHGHQAMRSTYEFLHASFGEFLIARWVVGELSRLGEQVRRAADDPYPQPPDDNKLHALLSVTVLSVREQRVLDFISDLLADQTHNDLAALRTLTGLLFRGCLQLRSHTPYTQYQPAVRTAPAAYAAYSANLVLLMLLIGEVQARAIGNAAMALLSGTELNVIGNSPVWSKNPLSKFHAVARLWHSQLMPSEWESLLDVVRVDLLPEKPLGSRTPAVGRWTRGDHQVPLSGYDILYAAPRLHLREDGLVRLDTLIGQHFREAALLGVAGYQDSCAALLPYISALGKSGNPPLFQTGSTAACMLALLIPTPLDGMSRAELYQDVFTQRPGIRPARLLLQRLSHDIRGLPLATLSSIVLLVTPYAWANICAYLDILAGINEVASSQESLLQVAARDLPLSLSSIMRESRTNDGRVSFLTLAAPQQLLALLHAIEIDSETEASDLLDLLRLTETNMDIDPHQLLGIYGIRQLVRLIGMLDLLDITGPADPLDLRDLDNLNDPVDRELSGDTSRTSLAWIALWAALTERELIAEAPPSRLLESDVRRLADIAPEFIARTNRLANEHGFSSPLQHNPQY